MHDPEGYLLGQQIIAAFRRAQLSVTDNTGKYTDENAGDVRAQVGISLVLLTGAPEGISRISRGSLACILAAIASVSSKLSRPAN